MRLIRRPTPPAPAVPGGCAATIGVYDGLHLGHQHIIRQLIGTARERGLPSLVFSFEPTPREYFARGTPPARLMRFREKFRALDALGVDYFYCPPFDARLEALAPRAFIEQLLVGTLGVRALVVGDDFRFGHGRAGTVADLKAAGRRHGFSVAQAGSFVAAGGRVSSTAVRAALAAGDMARARALLGRDYAISGRVVHGRKLGRELGFPTANVNLKRKASPVAGIFAVRVAGLGEDLLDGVASVGTRPTVDGTEPLLEVHIFDFDRDLYGEYLEVRFIARLRDEERFPDLDSLVAQMHIDARMAREILAA